MSDYLKKRMQHILDDRPLPEKKKYRLKPVSDKRAAKIAAEKVERGDDDTELVKWYKNRIKEMTGYCAETGMRTETNVYSAAIFSVCHILEKRDTLFPSVKTHPKNWIELSPDIHTDFDKATWEERELMGCWPIVWEKLLQVYLSIAPEELHHLPTNLRERIEKTLAQ